MKPRLLIASSETDADMYYATRILIPDEFIFLETEAGKKIYVSDLEFSRALSEARVDEVNNISARPSKYKDVLSWIIAENNLREASVPERFPLAYAEALRQKKVKLEIKRGSFFERRGIKEEEEVKEIRATQRTNEKAMRAAIEAIRKSAIRSDKKLFLGGRILTSEFLKELIEIEFVRGGCKSEDDIVSCAARTSQPHNSGSGPLLANQPIIIDIYPRSFRSRYYADMTRTVVKGKASPEIRKMYAAVLQGQKMAIKEARAGIEARWLFDQVKGYFEQQGYMTRSGSRSPEGFIHNLGHGIGLEIHEPPFLGPANAAKLRAGNVVTIEPGLYYPGIGGVRIEDMVLIKKDGCENLTRIPKTLELE